MPTPSPLASLIATLANVCQRADQNQALLRKNEAATRAALIDPVLRALGWDTTDVAMVVPEFAIGSKQRPDYFLKHHNGTVHFVIEAICLPNGQEHALKTWKDILVKVAELVVQTQDKLTIPLVDKAEKKTTLLSWTPPKKGLSFNTLIHQDKSLSLYTNYDSTGIVANALYLLQQLPKGASTDTALSF